MGAPQKIRLRQRQHLPLRKIGYRPCRYSSNEPRRCTRNNGSDGTSHPLELSANVPSFSQTADFKELPEPSVFDGSELVPSSVLPKSNEPQGGSSKVALQSQFSFPVGEFFSSNVFSTAASGRRDFGVISQSASNATKRVDSKKIGSRPSRSKNSLSFGKLFCVWHTC